MIVVSVVATILVLLGAAVSYTQHLSRQTQRTRKSALAMEIADGHLEHLFTYWRNLSRIQVNQAIKKNASTITSYSLPTQYFFTDQYNPGPAPTPSVAKEGLSSPPPIIPLPDKSLFPTEPNYTVTQYRIQGVDPMVALQTANATDPELSTVPVTDTGTGDPASSSQFDAAFGPNTSTTNGQYSFYYLASVDVQVPAIGNSSGFVTTKVRRVFEKKYDQPFSFAVLFMDDLELQPANSLTITGPIHTNGSLYIGTSNFTAATPTTTYPTSGRVTFSNMFVNGASSKDPLHTSFGGPNFPDREPPMMWPSFLPFGWDPNLTGTNNNNNDSYHELIEVPQAAITDPIAGVRFYNTSDYRILIDVNNNVTVTDINGNPANGVDLNDINSALSFNQSFQDVREGGPIRVTTLDVSKLSKNFANTTKNTGGPMLYIADTSAGTAVTFTPSGGSAVTTSKRSIRVKNGSTINMAGLAIVSANPVYIQGDFNTGGNPPSNSGTYTSPTVSGYWKAAVIIADSVNLLSNAWNDNTATASRVAANTTVNAAIIGGNVPSNGTNYSGGAENFIRLLENWGGKSLTYYGSVVQMWQSNQGTGAWTGSSTVYTTPGTYAWYYDTHLNNANLPGTFALAAYLQQQRWYQVY